MDAQQFLKAFVHVANAPGGVAKLRELVRTLAIQGKLVAQDPNEEHAANLLQKIRAEKDRLTSLGRMKRERPWSRVLEQETPFALPQGWSWARFGEITINRDGERVPVSSVNRTKIEKLYDYYGASGVIDKVDQFLFDQTLLLVGEDGANLINRSTPIAFLAHGKYWVNNHAHVIDATHRDLLDYLALFLNSISLEPYVTGTAQPKLNQARLSNIVVAIPPLAEQTRIVAKVNDLMALCDRLETQQQARRQLQNSLRQATLQAVASATSPHELQTTWASLTANFGRLFHAPEDVDDFIAELKNLAVRGLLETASVEPPALTAIKASCGALRASYIESGLMRRQKIVAAAETDVIYPAHWAVAPFDEVAIVIGGVTKGRNLRGRETLTRPYLAVANVQRGFFKLDGLKTIEIAADELEKYAVREGDLLITEGGDRDKVGRTAIWRSGVAACLHQNHVFKARVPSELLMNEWVELVFNSGVGRDYFAGASKQTTNLASINMTQLRGFPLPIPPLDEQRNLLKKFHSLTASALTWRQQLQRKQELAVALAVATVSTFTGIATIQPEEPMKAPQTELIAPLRLGQTPGIKAQAPLATILARHQGQMPAIDLWQRFGGEIDAFYAQLKTEVAHGWILEPAVAEVREVPAVVAEA
jgi:type I restriction enzyme S subunit